MPPTSQAVEEATEVEEQILETPELDDDDDIA